MDAKQALIDDLFLKTRVPVADEQRAAFDNYWRDYTEKALFHEIRDPWTVGWAAWRAACEMQQARIDALMIQYCPDEMTPEQLANYEAHQRPVSVETKGNYILDLLMPAA